MILTKGTNEIATYTFVSQEEKEKSIPKQHIMKERMVITFFIPQEREGGGEKKKKKSHLKLSQCCLVVKVHVIVTPSTNLHLGTIFVNEVCSDSM